MHIKKEKSCGAVIYRIVEGKIEFLLLHMSLGHISLCKGHQENNETEEETALREIKEETDLDVIIDTSFRSVITYSPYENIIKDVIFFIATPKDIFQVAIDKHDDEVISFEWANLEETLNKLTHSSDKKVVEDAYNFIIINKI